MSNVDISPEAVERLAFDFDNAPPCANNCGCAPACKVRTAETCMCSETAATLRALRAALTEAEAERDGANALIERMHAQDVLAIKAWQQANPGNDLAWPDQLRLTAWCLGEVAQAHAQRDAAAADMRERAAAKLNADAAELRKVALLWDGSGVQKMLEAAANALDAKAEQIRALPLTSEKGGSDAE